MNALELSRRIEARQTMLASEQQAEAELVEPLDREAMENRLPFYTARWEWIRQVRPATTPMGGRELEKMFKRYERL